MKVALDLLSVDFVGNAEGHDVALVGRADVIVTDGFTGNVVVKAPEGAIRMVGGALASAFTADGVVVVGRGRASPTAVAHCVYAAAQAVADGLVPQIGDALTELVAARRNRAGLEVATP